MSAAAEASLERVIIMNTRRNAELADRIAEERSENEGMPEHPDKARDPVRWAIDRRKRVSPQTSDCLSACPEMGVAASFSWVFAVPPSHPLGSAGYCTRASLTERRHGVSNVASAPDKPRADEAEAAGTTKRASRKGEEKMAKGQKRTNREAKKPKRPKAKVVATASHYAAVRAQTSPAPPKKS